MNGKNEKVDVVVMGAGTAGSNAAKAAVKSGARKVIMIHPTQLVNTCVEEGCMPSKSVLAGSHHGESLQEVQEIRDAHIKRLLGALTDSFKDSGFYEVIGQATFIGDKTISVTHPDGSTTVYEANSVVIATGSHPFTPPIPGLDRETLGDKLWISDDLVSRRKHLTDVPTRVLTIGGGPIGLELSTYLHDLGAEVDVLQRRSALTPFDPEFGAERVRASQDPSSFPIHLNCELKEAKLDGSQILATIEQDGVAREKHYDAILVATGRRPNLDGIGLDQTDIERDERGNITHDERMETSVPGVFIAGDVTGHHQILHFAAAMGKTAGHNAVKADEKIAIDYDKLMLAVSFDQFPSALIGLTETEAKKRGIEVVTATRNFSSVGLGILKRQEYGMWKLVADKANGKIIGSQILGPDSAGELIQVLTPIIANGNTYGEVLNMTWYHPTYAEILKSLARDLCHEDSTWCPGM